MPDPSDQTLDTSFQGLNQDAINGALQTYTNASQAYVAYTQQYDAAQRALDAAAADTTTPADTVTAAQAKLTAASTQLDGARTQLGNASRDYSNITAKLAVAEQGKARAATDPQQQALWTSEAQKAQSQSELYGAESDMYQAKTQSQIDSAGQRATAALQNAASRAQQVQNQGDASRAQALLATAKAGQLPALTQSTVQLHSAQIQLASSRSTQALSQANLNDARSAYISGPEAQQAEARGDLSKAEADAIIQQGGAKLGDLVAKGVLDQTRAQQIVTNMSKWTVVSYQDKNNPTIVQQQQSTGQITAVPNPGYVNSMLQPIQDRAAAIQGIRDSLAKGEFGTGPQAVAYANQLVDGLNQTALLQAQGYTPQSYQQAIQNQATAGQNTLTGIQDQGTSMANTLLDAAKGARTATPMTPYENAQAMGGGPQAMQQAFSLISQVKPIASRMDALDAYQKYSQASALLHQAAGTTPAQGGPAATPTGDATQAAGAAPAANMAAQAQRVVQGAPGGGSMSGGPTYGGQPIQTGNPLGNALLLGAGIQGGA